MTNPKKETMYSRHFKLQNHILFSPVGKQIKPTIPVGPDQISSRRGALHLGHMACRPPSTGRLTPVMKVAASDARKAME